MRNSFSDVHAVVEETIAEGEMECYRRTCTMRHTGNGPGFRATGKTCHVTGITIMRFVGGKPAEAWQNWDMLGLMQQISGEAKAPTYFAAGPAR